MSGAGRMQIIVITPNKLLHMALFRNIIRLWELEQQNTETNTIFLCASTFYVSSY